MYKAITYTSVTAIALLTLSLSNLLNAEELTSLLEPPADNSACTTFEDKHYLVDPSAISEASNFFLNLQATLLVDLHPFKLNKGTQYIEHRYYDFPSLDLLQSGKEIGYRKILGLPSYREDKHRIYWRDNVSLSETKFSTRAYSRRSTAEDSHSLIGKIKRSERATFSALINENFPSSDQIDLEESLSSNQEVFSYLITHFGEPVAKLGFSKFALKNFGVPNTRAAISFEIIKQNTKALTPKELSQLNMLMCETNSRVNVNNQAIHPVKQVSYQVLMELARQDLPTRDLFKSQPNLYLTGQVISLSLVFFLILYLFIGRYERKASYTSRYRNDRK